MIDQNKEDIVFKGVYRARKIGTSNVLTAPSAVLGTYYALFETQNNLLVFVPIPSPPQ